MTNNKKNFYGVSLAALAFSLCSATQANAQTCTVPPDCTTLGFTKTSAECDGKTILKCPFDQTKVYCPGYEESSKTYGIGDTYAVNGVAVGKVISVTDCVGGSNGNIVYGTPKECLGISGSSYNTNLDSAGNQIYTSPDSDKTCTYGRFYNNMGGYTTGYMRISGTSAKCSHGTISSPVVRTGTRKEAIENCAKMAAGGMSWYLPSTYNGYFFGYGSSISSQPYMSGAWAVANGCFYNGSFYPAGSVSYQGSCQTRSGGYPDYTYADKEMSYYCITMF